MCLCDFENFFFYPRVFFRFVNRCDNVRNEKMMLSMQLITDNCYSLHRYSQRYRILPNFIPLRRKILIIKCESRRRNDRVRKRQRYTTLEDSRSDYQEFIPPLFIYQRKSFVRPKVKNRRKNFLADEESTTKFFHPSCHRTCNNTYDTNNTSPP